MNLNLEQVLNTEVNQNSKAKLVASGLIPFALVIVLIAYIFGPGAEMLDLGIPLPEILLKRSIL